MNLWQWIRKRLFRGRQDERPVREPERDEQPKDAPESRE
jgi:hypothetical protein